MLPEGNLHRQPSVFRWRPDLMGTAGWDSNLVSIALPKFFSSNVTGFCSRLFETNKPNYFSDEFLWLGVLREDCPQYQPFNYLHESGSAENMKERNPGEGILHQWIFSGKIYRETMVFTMEIHGICVCVVQISPPIQATHLSQRGPLAPCKLLDDFDPTFGDRK